MAAFVEARESTRTAQKTLYYIQALDMGLNPVASILSYRFGPAPIAAQYVPRARHLDEAGTCLQRVNASSKIAIRYLNQIMEHIVRCDPDLFLLANVLEPLEL